MDFSESTGSLGSTVSSGSLGSALAALAILAYGVEGKREAYLQSLQPEHLVLALASGLADLLGGLGGLRLGLLWLLLFLVVTVPAVVFLLFFFVLVEQALDMEARRDTYAHESLALLADILLISLTDLLLFLLDLLTRHNVAAHRKSVVHANVVGRVDVDGVGDAALSEGRDVDGAVLELRMRGESKSIQSCAGLRW